MNAEVKATQQEITTEPGSPSAGSFAGILSSDLIEPPPEEPRIRPEVDIRLENLPMPAPTAMGPAYAVSTHEIMRRGIKTLTPDELAEVVAGYLSTQNQSLSPFKTPFDEEQIRQKNEVDADNRKRRSFFQIALFIMAVIFVIVVFGVLITTVMKQGVLTDSGVFHGIFNMAQEIFRVILAPSSY